MPKLIGELRAGASFAAYAKQHSRDAGTRDKGGEFATIYGEEGMPPALKPTLVKLKKGEVSEPVRIDTGFYIFYARDLRTKSFDDARNDISNQLVLDRQQEYLKTKEKDWKVEILNEEYFKQPVPQPAKPAAQQRGTASKEAGPMPAGLRLACADSRWQAPRLGIECIGKPIRILLLEELHAFRNTAIGGPAARFLSGHRLWGAAHLRQRFIVLDPWLLRHPGHHAAILLHELAHFAWLRLGNARRRQWCQLLVDEAEQRDRRVRGFRSLA